MPSPISSAETESPPVRLRQRSNIAPAMVGLVLLAVATIVYLPVRHHGFVAFDDPTYVADNPMVQGGLTWSGIRWAFTTGYASNWHPVTWLSHLIDAQLFGTSAAGPHVVNVLLHLVNSLLVFLVLRALTRAQWRSLFVAAVFALHPLHVESVAWISERKDVLSAFFFLLTLMAYVRYVRVGRCWYFAVVLLFALGLMSKPMLVTAPFVLLLLDAWPLERLSLDDWRSQLWPLVLEKLLLFVFAVASSIVTFVVQRQGGAVSSLARFDLNDRIANAVVSYVRYLGKTLWPADLAVFYPHPGHWAAGAVMGAATLIAALLASAMIVARWRPFALVGWGWFFGMLVPTIGLVQVGSQAMADRYMYLPMIGGLIVVTWIAADLLDQWRVPKPVIAIVAALLVGVSAKLTATQVSYWRDSETLFRHAIACTEGNGLAHDKLGNVMLERGKVDEAIEHYRRAVQFQPSFPEFHNNLGNALWRKKQAEEAIASYRRALEIDPGLAVTHQNIGVVLLDQGNFKEALACFTKAVELDPSLPDAQNNLGTVLIGLGRLDEALVHIQLALQLNPNDPNALNNRGNILSRKNRLDEAVADFRRALAVRPDLVGAQTNLGRTLLQQGQLDAGLAELQKALLVEPNLAEAHYRIGSALLQSGRLDDAIPFLQKAVALQPDSVQSRNDLGVAFIQQGRVDEALAQFRKAVEIAPDFAEGHSNVGKVLQHKGEMRLAVASYKAALKLEPSNPDTLSSLAWILATSPDPMLRSGTEAAMFAQRANQHTGNRQPVLLRTLAAAYAEVGRFPEAISTVQRAIKLAAEQADADLVNALRADFAVYTDGSPLRDRGAEPAANEPHANGNGR